MMAKQTPQWPIFFCPRCEEKGGLVTEVTDGQSFPEQKKRAEVTGKGELMGEETCLQEGFLMSGHGISPIPHRHTRLCYPGPSSWECQQGMTLEGPR